MSNNPFRRPAVPAMAAVVILLLSTSAPAATKHKKQEAAPAAPSTAESLGGAGSWSAYAAHDATGRVCYLVGRPEKSEGAGARKTPMAMVTHRPAENIANVVSFVEGYPLKEGTDVALEIGDRKFELFTKDDSAWARTAELDRSIVGVLGRGKSAVVKGVPQKGKPTTDVYSLSGFSKALALIDKACGVKREETAPTAKRAPSRKREKHRAAGQEH